MRGPGRIVILGAGPAGLGAAYRLHELGHDDWLLCEAREGPGGLAASWVDPRGFTWDCGGHVQFSHYGYYDAVLDRALGDRWLHHRRRAGVWLDGELIPYPLQHNLHRLPPAARERALAGLEQAAHTSPQGASRFSRVGARDVRRGARGPLLRAVQREGLGLPAAGFGWSWIGERVALPDLARLRR